MVFAKLIHAADIASSDHVLDVGCATGYGAAVLARLAGQVTALEQARRPRAGRPYVTRRTVQGERRCRPSTAGWPQGGPYDAIVLEGATEVVPQAYLSQLKEGGRLVCVLGSAPAAKAMLYCRSGDDLGGLLIFDATAALLPGFVKAPAFAF